MATGSPVLFADFSGGLNLEAGPYLVQENECQDARNFTATKQGALTKRNGFVEFANLTNNNTDAGTQIIDNIHSLFPVNLASKQLVGVGKTTSASNDSIVKITTGGNTSSLKDGLTQNTRWEFVQGPVATNDVGAEDDQGPIYGINGVDTPQYWDGTATDAEDWIATTGEVPSTAKYLVYHLDKFWASGDPLLPGRVWSTGVNALTDLPDPCNWDSDFIDNVDPADGQTVTGLGTVGPYLLVFKARKSYVLSDPQNRPYRTLSSSIGCSSHRSIVETTQGTFFLSEDLGVCVTDGSNIEVVSEKIGPLLRQISNNFPAALKNASGTFHNNSYYLSLPYTNSTNSITLEYQLDSGAWWVHTCASNQFALLDPTGTPKLYSAHPTNLTVDQAFAPNVYSDHGASYFSYWKGPYLAWGQPHLNKRLSQFRVDGRGVWQLKAATTFSGSDGAYQVLEGVDWEIPEDTSSTKFGGVYDFGEDGTFGPQLGITQKRYYTPSAGWGRAWSLEFSDLSNANLTEIFSVAAFTRPRAD